MRIGSLFSGYGGLDMAVQSVLGGEVAWVSDIEPASCQVLAAHHPGVMNLGDITTVNWADIEPVDILTGGYPCQPFSHAGQRKGKNDERHLWPYVSLPSMRYDLASSSWRTSAATSLWDLEMSSPTFPEWGMTRGGELYELPTPERPTVAPASSSLPTPTARDYKDTQIRREPHRPDDTDTLSRALTILLPTPTATDTPKHAGQPPHKMVGHQARISDVIEYLPQYGQMDPLLPTPVADHSRGLAQPGTDFQSLPNVAMSLLPTPTAQAAKHGETPDVNANGFGSNLWDLPQKLENAVAQIGESTPPPSPAGSASSTEKHPAPPSPEPTDDHDCLPLSWNG